MPNAQPQVGAEARILDWPCGFLSRPPFTDNETDILAKRV